MPTKTREIRLKVSELSAREDFGCGIARMDLSKIRELEISEGDIIELKAGKSVGCVVLACENCGEYVKIDSIARRNLEANLGDYITARKTKTKEAETITLSLARKGLNIHLSGEELKNNLLLRPLRAGEVILANPLPGRAGSFHEILNKDVARALFSTTLEEKFVVVSTNPDGIVRVSDSTEVYISTESAAQVKDLEEPFGSKTINVKKLPELKNFLELRSIDDVKKLINSGTIVNRYEDDKFVVYFGANYFFKILKAM